MTTHDFGYGAVPAHQHANGGGWVADTASVEVTAYVGVNARVCGNARVCDIVHVSITPLILEGGEYCVTITDRHVGIGCHTHTVDEWESLTPETCPFLESTRSEVLAIARKHQARVK